MNLFANVNSIMNDTNMIDSCQAHLLVLRTSNSFARSDTCIVIDSELHLSHVQNKPLVRSIGCPCSHGLFRFSVLRSEKTVNTITYQIQNCFVS